jgi:uroporphyrinogen-III decarboxylase
VVTSYLGSRVVGRKYNDFVLNPLLAYKSLAEMHRRFGFDGFEVPIAPARNLLAPKTSVIDGRKYIVDDAGEPVSEMQEDDAPISCRKEVLLQKKKDLDKVEIKPASWYIENGCTDPVAKLVKEVSDGAFIAGHAAGQIMNALAAWRGSEQAMLDIMDDPAFVHAVMERATDISIEVGKALISAGVDGIYIGDAWASASIISPAIYEEFCLPYHRKASETFQNLGAKVYLHICGNSQPMLHLMAQTGVDAIEPLDVDGGVKLEEVRARVGGKICLKGGVSTLLLLRGSREEVYKESRRCIDLLGSQSYILGSTDDIPRETHPLKT